MLEELSDQPAILRSITVLSGNIHYDEEQGQLVSQNARDEELISLNAILRDPLWEIKELSLEQARDIPHHLFEG